MNKQELKSFLKQQNIQPLKRFGQNFLINQKTIQKIIHIVYKQAPPFVEIGPGPGALTTHFSNKKKDILLIERDKKIASYWKNKGYSVLFSDALKLDWSQSLPKKCTVFGNLPYQIAGSLVLKSCLHQKQITSMVLMMQKEVAQRVIAKPKNKNYSLLSVVSQTFWIVSPKLLIPKTAFHPQPKVEGSLLEFQAKKENSDLDPSSFLKFVKAGFAFKRKKLIKKIASKETKEIKKIFQNLNLSENCRAEELSVEQFIKLYFDVQENIKREKGF